jgi:hypothetical protein
LHNNNSWLNKTSWWCNSNRIKGVLENNNFHKRLNHKFLFSKEEKALKTLNPSLRKESKGNLIQPISNPMLMTINHMKEISSYRNLLEEIVECLNKMMKMMKLNKC